MRDFDTRSYRGADIDRTVNAVPALQRFFRNGRHAELDPVLAAADYILHAVEIFAYSPELSAHIAWATAKAVGFWRASEETLRFEAFEGELSELRKIVAQKLEGADAER